MYFTILLTLIFTTVVCANEGEYVLFDNLNYQKSDNIRVYVDSNQISFDINPQIINGRTLVPMRAIFEAIGLNVEWDNSNQIAKGSNEENLIIFTIGSNLAKANGQEKSLDVPATTIGNRTMVPLRFLSENMGYNVVWVGDSNLILMSKNNIIEWRYEGYENIEPYKNYERKYINGVKIQETRYSGSFNEPLIEWRIEGYESESPHKEYERKYVDGKMTTETRYTGKTKPYEVKKPIAISGINAFKTYGWDSYVNLTDVEIYWRNNSNKTISEIIFEYEVSGYEKNKKLIVKGPIKPSKVEPYIYVMSIVVGGQYTQVNDYNTDNPYYYEWVLGEYNQYGYYEKEIVDTYLSEEQKLKTVLCSQFPEAWTSSYASLYKIDITYSDGTKESLSRTMINDLVME